MIIKDLPAKNPKKIKTNKKKPKKRTSKKRTKKTTKTPGKKTTSSGHVHPVGGLVLRLYMWNYVYKCQGELLNKDIQNNYILNK